MVLHRQTALNSCCRWVRTVSVCLTWTLFDMPQNACNAHTSVPSLIQYSCIRRDWPWSPSCRQTARIKYSSFIWMRTNEFRRMRFGLGNSVDLIDEISQWREREDGRYEAAAQMMNVFYYSHGGELACWGDLCDFNERDRKWPWREIWSERNLRWHPTATYSTGLLREHLYTTQHSDITSNKQFIHSSDYSQLSAFICVIVRMFSSQVLFMKHTMTCSLTPFSPGAQTQYSLHHTHSLINISKNSTK